VQEAIDAQQQSEQQDSYVGYSFGVHAGFDAQTQASTVPEVIHYSRTN